ncbi:MAG: hypothetical protein HYY57_02475, partial [Candidatus Omnitrophica bacterium]|nr:hypothetical protein [Candidatus Omnitrophota bacterium]
YNLRTQRWSWPQDWSLLFYVTTGVQLATPPAFGRLEGRVFQDENRNEVLDRGELGTGDVLVRVGDQEVLTDDQGRFKFPRAVPGVQRVILDVANLDPTWVPQESEQMVDIKRYRPTVISFPLTKATSIRGAVFIDDNEDGIFQEHEEPLEGIAIVMKPDEQFRRTDANGEFFFDHLRPGRYRIEIYTADLPTGYESFSTSVVEVEAVGEEGVRDVNFAVRLIPGPVTEF